MLESMWWRTTANAEIPTKGESFLAASATDPPKYGPVLYRGHRPTTSQDKGYSETCQEAPGLVRGYDALGAYVPS
jgi:hypothetical protein